ncbi:MAG: TonB family protein [Parvibaculaceae bacterium]|nr:TonB family protein [Parvibaculaceae bacterium]
MEERRLFRTILALGVAASLHLVALNAFAQQKNEVLIKGGRLQVELGINAKSSPQMVAGAMASAKEKPQEREPDVEEHKTKPPLPDPEPIVEPDDAPVSENAVTPEIPVERREKPKKKKEEPKAKPKPKLVKPVKKQVPPKKVEKKLEEKVTEATPPPMPEGGAPSLASAGSDADAAGVPQPEAAPGNAASQNYKGDVMAHLSARRRPRASGAGFAMVAFLVTSSGGAENTRIATSSGVAKFDRAALKFVKRAAPFPKPPANVRRDFVVKIEGD